MKNTKRSAFTIVELVIVIAVIAILSAVLIPTFGAIIKDANIAADQTAAATLTTELHVDLMGETIDSEAELMERIAKIDAKKLTPKSLSYGYHYWFDMENQRIVAERSDIVASKATPVGDGESTSVQSGAQLMSAVLTGDPIAQNNNSVNISFRDVYGIGWYLIDGSGTLAEVVETLTNKNTGINEFKDAIGKLNAFEIEDALCDKIEVTVNSTIIVTNNGTFYPTNATNVSFADGVTSITNTQYAVTSDSDTTSVNTTPAPTESLPLASGNVVIPDTVTCVEDNSFNFVAESTVNVEIKEENLNVFCPDSTNVTINTTLEIKVNQEGTSQIVDTSDNDKVIVEELVSSEGRFPGFSFDILKSNAEDNTYAWNNNTLYVYYNAFKNLGNKLELALTTDGTNPVDDTKGFVKWTCTGGANVGTITDNGSTVYNILGATADGTVTGEVTLRDGTKASKSFDVVMVKPTAATVSIGEKAIGLGTGGVQAPSFEWGYDGTNGTRTISFNVTGYSHQIANGVSNISVTVDSEAFTYDETTKKLTLNTKGGSGDDAINLAKTGVVDITLSIDGVLQTTVKATLIDYTKAEFESNFHYTASTDRPYYIGKGEITLGHILKLKNSELTYDNYNVSVEVVFGDAYVEVEDLKNSGWEVDYDTTLTDENWESTKINIKSASIATTPIRVKITPAAANSDAYTVAINLTYVNGTNVLDAASLLTAATAENTNVVIMKDITLADNANSSNYSLNFTTGETLYGNGFVVNATNYVNGGSAQTYYRWEKTGEIKKCSECGAVNPGVTSDCYNALWGHAEWDYSNISTEDVYGHVNKGSYYASTDACLINLTGGTVDNIYVNGPVYPTLQYKVSDGSLSEAYTAETDDAKANATTVNYVNTPYFVSGIKSTGTSTVKNSYVSGFRQPVKVDEGTLSLNTSTLYGGNYANLQLNKGTLSLTDVTTVQPNTGIRDTFNVGNDVIGLGIVVEASAVDGSTSAINVSGYLNQYNWVSANTTADLPKLTVDGTEIDFKVVLASMFKGIKVAGVTKEMGFLDNYIETVDGVDYLNSGIMFVAIDTGSVASNAKTNISKLTVTETSRVTNTGAKLPKFTATSLPLFSQYLVISAGDTIQLYANQMVRALEVFSVDNDGYATAGVTEIMGTGALTDDNPIDVYLKVWSYHKDNVTLGTTTPINYPGYTYGN